MLMLWVCGSITSCPCFTVHTNIAFTHLNLTDSESQNVLTIQIPGSKFTKEFDLEQFSSMKCNTNVI